MIEMTFKNADDAMHAIISGKIQEGDWVIDDERNLELYVYKVYTDVQSILQVAIICCEQLYDANECAIGIGDKYYFLTPDILAHLRVEIEREESKW